ncbi:hypothetical protein EDB82DRAFT_109937 [Fusarium venenatum]|uniref:uncharacterized protein n=1 Tax=Fusarium venenatum TaxID=56646 RepID=UPI001D7F4FD9|nr:hypothetical protein EDB82DRAFT_109937 [Fusarium venenatum]
MRDKISRSVYITWSILLELLILLPRDLGDRYQRAIITIDMQPCSRFFEVEPICCRPPLREFKNQHIREESHCIHSQPLACLVLGALELWLSGDNSLTHCLTFQPHISLLLTVQSFRR